MSNKIAMSSIVEAIVSTQDLDHMESELDAMIAIADMWPCGSATSIAIAELEDAIDSLTAETLFN